MNHHPLETAPFRGLADLASERLGGRALNASDDFFAAKENLVRAAAPVFEPERYTERGKWMDGWETRRRRTPGFDWCVVALGLPGTLQGVDIDTRHFLGNHPPYASLEACCLPGASLEALAREGAWQEILPRSPLSSGSHNYFTVHSGQTVTHLRLKIYPDGGVARLRAFGAVRPDWSRYRPGEPIDLAALANGGQATACSDMFFSSMGNLLLPGESTHMGDGWETRRRRGPGHDWVVVRLGATARLCRIEVDTRHFFGNYPDKVSFDACHRPEMPVDQLTCSDVVWKQILPPRPLGPDRVEAFQEELLDPGPWTYVRMNIHPDGGVARLRVWGQLGGTMG